MSAVKTPDKYRFTLQWDAESEEKIRAGNFLESLGNRKSEFIVMAVTEYLTAHPETQAAGRGPRIIVRPSFTQEQIKAMIMAAVEEKLAGIVSDPRNPTNPHTEPAVIEPDIDEMLKNLDVF